MKAVEGLCFTIVLAVALPTGVGAQSRKAAPVVLELPASTAALAMGNAFPIGLAHPDVIFYHPALVEEGAGVAVGVQRYGTSGTLGTVAAAAGVRGGTFGLGVRALAYGAPAAGAVDLADSLLGDGQVGASELAATLAYGRRFKRLRLGAAVHVLEQRLGNRHDAALAGDVGVATVIRFVTLGLSVQHLGARLQTTVVDRPLPARVTLASSTDRRPVGPLDLAASAAVSRWQDGSVVPAGGLEVSYWPIAGRTFVARAGLRRVPHGGASPLTLGAAFIADDWTFEYAFEAFEGPGSGHRFGLRWQ